MLDLGGKSVVVLATVVGFSLDALRLWIVDMLVSPMSMEWHFHWLCHRKYVGAGISRRCHVWYARLVLPKDLLLHRHLEFLFIIRRSQATITVSTADMSHRAPLTIAMMHQATFSGNGREVGGTLADGRSVSGVAFVGSVRSIEHIDHPGGDSIFEICDGTGLLRVIKDDSTRLWKIGQRQGRSVEGGEEGVDERPIYVFVVGHLTTDGTENIVQAEHIRRVFDLSMVVHHFRSVLSETYGEG